MRTALRNDVVINLLGSLEMLENHIAKTQIPKTKGIYFWKNNKTEAYEYIGIATNKQGLYGRIFSKHLKEDYLEGRETKHSSSKDAYQLKNPIIKESRPGKKFIDKSSFRKNVGRAMRLCPGKETLDYIKENGRFYFYSFEDIENIQIEIIETILISTFQPIYNISKKNQEVIQSDTMLEDYKEVKVDL
tara:strand:- start:336 stop:902 length:567 start_codon:yes stop_codon:yes gene_type:complete